MINDSIIRAVVSDKLGMFSLGSNFFSISRDIFTARLQSYILESQKYLEAALIGEIGNNTFDHNFGFISENPGGVYCDFTYSDKYIVLSDYGKGVRQSLLNVLPQTKNDMEAVEIAFTKRISGRSPELRGNGLKFVAEAIISNNWHLYFQSGNGSCKIDKDGMFFHEEEISLSGCLAILDFDGDN